MKMLSKFFAKPEPEPAVKPRWSIPDLVRLFRHFPIGSRVSYFPESKKDLRLESVILGCTINRHFVFSQGQIQFHEDAGGPKVVLTEDDTDFEVKEIQNVNLLIPFQARSEIDYQSGADDESGSQLYQKNANDFNRDNVITLISQMPQGGVPHMETTVRSLSVLTKGFYANHKVVMLDPFLNTLTEVDQRRLRRVVTRIPLALRVAREVPPVACILEDFSERFIRVRMAEADAQSDQLAIGRRLALALESSEPDHPFTFQGTIHRKKKNTVIIELKAILREGRFVEFQLVDQLAFKAALLEHPATQEALKKKTPKQV